MVRAIGAYSLSECMEIMADLVYKAEQANGAKNIVFCEDRLTLIAERAMTAKIGGSFRSYVTTYARALKTKNKVLTVQGSVMVIDGIITALQKEGKLCRFTHSVPRGTAKSLYETIAQLAASAIDEETLKESAGELEEGLLKDKVKDIAVVYAEYKKFLRDNAYVDESGYLSLLPESLKEQKTFENANVYFLCYGSFTAQALKTVQTAFEKADNVTGIFCYGNEDFYTGFSRRAFLNMAKSCGVEVQSINQGTPLWGEAEILRKGLFNPLSFSKSHEKYRTNSIRLFEAEDKNDEAEKVAVAIKKHLAKDGDMRYRDFAVLTSDTKGYTLAIKKAFSEYNIPFFLDERRTLKTHPLSMFILNCFEAVRTGFLPETIDAILSSIYFGEADDYRNYLLKFANFRGGVKRAVRNFVQVQNGDEEGGVQEFVQVKSGDEDRGVQKFVQVGDSDKDRKSADNTAAYLSKNATLYNTADLQKKREKLLGILDLIPKKANGKTYCAAIREILRKIDAEEKLKELLEKAKDVALQSYLEQIDGILERLLGEAETLLGGREMSVTEFEMILSDGLDATEVALIPVKTDAVFVGDISESRIERVRVLFVVGMDESIPKNTSDTALISDREIEKLAEVKAKMEPTVAEVNLRGREDAALNLCTFTDAAYFSYALTADGSEPALSEVFRYLSALFLEKDGEELTIKKGRSEEDFIYYCSAVMPALKIWQERRETDEKNGIYYTPVCNAIGNALLSYQCGDDTLIKEKGNAWAAYKVSGGEELFFHDGKISPTALEKYFSCPFSLFMNRGLRLKEREEQTIQATDSGNFVHELLQKTVAQFETITTEGEARALAQEIGENLLKKPPYSYGSETTSGEYASNRLLREGVEAAAAVFRQLKGSLYHVEAMEKPVEIQGVHGKIDRVDVSDDFVRIVDYKTGSFDDSAASYYMGRKLQLELYMTAAKGDKIPAGIFYFPASLNFSDGKISAFRMQGYYCKDEAALRAGDASFDGMEKEEESALFNFKKEGRENSRGMDRMTFSDFIDYSLLVTENAREEIAWGFIAASPYSDSNGGSCAFCPYGGACGINPQKSLFRKSVDVNSKGIASIVRQVREGENENDDKEINANKGDGENE